MEIVANDTVSRRPSRAIVAEDATSHESEAFQLLFEIEHSVECKQLRGGRPSHFYKTTKDTKACSEVDPYKEAADAVIGCMCELLVEVECAWYSIVVNRRVLRQEDRQSAVGARFRRDEQQICEPIQERAMTDNLLSPSKRSSAMSDKSALSLSEKQTASAHSEQAGAEETAQPPKPSPSGTRRGMAARYPRPGSFEVTVYNPQRRSHRVLYSKYHKHKLPSGEEEIWNELLPFLLVFAGQSNDEALMNRVATFASRREMVVQLPVDELRELQGNSLLLTCLVDSLVQLKECMSTGNPEFLSNLIDDIPHGLRTEDVVVAEKRLDHLCSVEKRVSDALLKIGAGLVTSGMESLQQAIEFATHEHLSGSVMAAGTQCLLNAGGENSGEDSEIESQGNDNEGSLRQRSKDYVRAVTVPVRVCSKRFSASRIERSFEQSMQGMRPQSGRSSRSNRRISSKDLSDMMERKERQDANDTSSRNPSKDRRASQSSKRFSTVGVDGGGSRQSKVCRNAMVAAEVSIAARNLELDVLKLKLQEAVKDFSQDIGITTFAESSVAASAAPIETTVSAPASSPLHTPPERPDSGSSASRAEVVEPVTDTAVWDNLLLQTRHYVREHSENAQRCREYSASMEAKVIQAEASARMVTRKDRDELELHLQAQSKLLSDTYIARASANIEVEAERERAHLRSEEVCEAQAKCRKALDLCSAYEVRTLKALAQEAAASQACNQATAHQEFLCELAVCDAVSQEEAACRAEFSELLACEAAVAEATLVKDAAGNAGWHMVDQIKRELAAYETSANEAAGREASAHHQAMELLRERSLEMVANETAACENALVQAASAKAATCEALSRQLEAKADQAAATSHLSAATRVSVQHFATSEASIQLREAKQTIALEQARWEVAEQKLLSQEATVAGNECQHLKIEEAHHMQMLNCESQLEGALKESALAFSELRAEKARAQQRVTAVEGRLAEANRENSEALQAAHATPHVNPASETFLQGQLQPDSQTEAAPGEAPFTADLRAMDQRIAHLGTLPNRESHTLANASRGEAPMGAPRAHAGPGEEGYRESEPVVHPLRDPLGQGSTGEAPSSDTVEPRASEAQMPGQSHLGSFGNIAGSGAAPDSGALPSPSTGQAPQSQRSTPDIDKRANIPNQGAPHSTGEAPEGAGPESDHAQTGLSDVEIARNIAASGQLPPTAVQGGTPSGGPQQHAGLASSSPTASDQQTIGEPANSRPGFDEASALIESTMSRMKMLCSPLDHGHHADATMNCSDESGTRNTILDTIGMALRNADGSSNDDVASSALPNELSVVHQGIGVTTQSQDTMDFVFTDAGDSQVLDVPGFQATPLSPLQTFAVDEASLSELGPPQNLSGSASASRAVSDSSGDLLCCE